MNDYLTYRNNLKLGLVNKPVKVPQLIAKRSDRMKQEMKLYIPAAKQYIIDNPLCTLKMEGCTILSTSPHHKAGRLGVKLHDKEDWEPACDNCQLKAEIFDQEARENGHKKTRLGKVNKQTF